MRRLLFAPPLLLSCAGASPSPSPTLVVLTAPPVASAEAAPPEPVEPETASDDGWRMFHGDIARSGHVHARPIHKPRVKWRADLGIMGWLNGPVVSENLVIVPSSGKRHNDPDELDGVFAFDLRSGKQIWHTRTGADANGAAIARDYVIVTSDDGNVYSLELSTGRVLWKREGEGKMYSNPLPLGDRVVVGDAAGYLRAYSLDGGAVLWAVKLDGAIRGGASSDGRHIFAASQGGEVVALRSDGSVLWRNNLSTENNIAEIYATPIVHDKSIIIPFARDTYYSTPALVALSKKGEIQWRARAKDAEWGNIRSAPALIDGTLVYAEPYSGDIVGIDAKTGNVRYRKEVGPCFFPQWASPAAADKIVYVPRYDGAVYAVAPQSGDLSWKLYLGSLSGVGKYLPAALANQKGCAWSVPTGSPLYAPAAIADDGTLLVGSGEGRLFAIVDEDW